MVVTMPSTVAQCGCFAASRAQPTEPTHGAMARSATLSHGEYEYGGSMGRNIEAFTSREKHEEMRGPCWNSSASRGYGHQDRSWRARPFVLSPANCAACKCHTATAGPHRNTTCMQQQVEGFSLQTICISFSRSLEIINLWLAANQL